MALNLQVENVVSTTAQTVKDQNGNTSPLILSTDKVGIGTLSPAEALEVNGRIKSGALTIGPWPANPNRYTFFGTNALNQADAGNYALLQAAADVDQGVTFLNSPVSIHFRIGNAEKMALANNGNVGIGTMEPREKLEVNGNIVTNGDIRLTNADCAEDFDICETEQVEPGTVMVLGEEGVLYPSQQPYDKRVAGVISGAGDYKPGIVLDKQESSNTRKPIALLGKVYCKVDAQYGVIEVGDLLTTSPMPGHAMKAHDPLKALGAMLGKALRPLAEGQGLIPILIALQ
jgi:hypothetical protein